MISMSGIASLSERKNSPVVEKREEALSKRKRSFRAKKSLGQNFLVSEGVRDKIFEAAAPAVGELIFEIGAGKGALTGKLASTGAKVVAFEIDPELVRELGDLFNSSSNIEVVRANIEGVSLDEEAKRRGFVEYKLVGNIPYYLTSTILLSLAGLVGCKRAVLMMQREVAERITAGAGTRECGTLTILLNSYFKIDKLMKVKPGSFRPVPKVESIVLIFEPDVADGAPPERMKFFEFLKKFFSMRRKRIESILRKVFGVRIEEVLERNRKIVDLMGLRPENLTLSQWYMLYNMLGTEEKK